MVRPVAWSKKGETSEVEIPTQQGTNLSVLGCMSWYGLLALSQQVSKLFVQEISSVLKDFGLENMYIVIDNATIHKTPDVLQAIRDNGHIPLFLPPYSPFLNPIEECWSKIKTKVRKSPLQKNENSCHSYPRSS
ncbi:hypothetical protein K501DRAFT_85198 [Backusella circina FSU 941]|nr:hypothetical protein K501DRAFT_85198 [Backusella circina FSU 941]